MKPIRIFLPVLLLLAGAVTGPLHSQWKLLDGPYGGSISALAVSGTDVFAGVGGSGIYRSTDGSASWTSVDGGLLHGYVESLVATESTVFVSMGDTLYRSSDRGVSWGPLMIGSGPIFTRFLSLVGARLYAGTSRGLFYSTNHGGDWIPANAGLKDSLNVETMCALENDLFVGAFYRLYRSTDEGASWARADSGLSAWGANSLLGWGGKLFAGTQTGLYVSTNRGISWVAAGPPLANVYTWMLASSGNTLFASDMSHLYRSTDAGTSWSIVTAGLPGGLYAGRVSAIVSLGSRLFAGLNTDGVYVSTDEGASWQESTRGIRAAGITALALIGNSLLAGTPDALFRSTDDGATWFRSAAGLADTAISCLGVSGTAVLAGTQHGIFRSTNEGVSWGPVGIGVAETPITAFGVQGKTVLAGFHGGAFISGDGGISWDSVRSQLRGKIPGQFAASDSAMFAAASPFGLFVSRDSGMTWRLVNSGLTTEPPYALAVVDKAVLMQTNAGLLRSTNNGDTWARLTQPGDRLALSDLAGAGNTLFGATTSFSSNVSVPQIWVSSDFGARWTDVSSGLSALYINALRIAGNDLYCFPGEGGVWRRPIREMITSGKDIQGSVAKTFALEQNYPNPFNPTTTIRYIVPARSPAVLTVYNTLGQKVADLVNQEVEAGTHEVTLSARTLASGVYFYRLRAGSFTQTRAMLVVR